MLRTLALIILAATFVFPPGAHAQVMKTAVTLPRGDLSIGGAPTVFIDGAVNEIALFVYGQYGLGNSTNLRVRAGFYETTNYIGGNFEWVFSRASPAVSFSLGGHYQQDPGADATLNFSGALSRYLHLYGGIDADLIVDDDPDLPLWAFLGTSYQLLDRVDIMVEFNYGFVEVAPHVVAGGFVFYF